MSETFKYLFTPLQIGPITVRNRITYSAHSAYYGERVTGWPSERHVYYHSERAKGGVGLGVFEAVRVVPNTLSSARAVGGFDPAALPAFRAVVEACHTHGMPLVAQLVHMGRQMTSTETRLPLYAPSAIPCGLNREIPHAMSQAEIAELVQAFGQSARMMREAGFDGVELHAAHGYLIQQFMSPFSNRRTDEYGGSLDNRLRFAQELIEEISAAIGSDRVLGLRLSADEFTEGGLTLDDTREIARRLEATGKIHYLSVSQCNYNPPSFPTMIPDETFPMGAFVYLASSIRDVVRIPVFAVGRIKDPVQAEHIVADGHADMIIMTRALISDPELPNKAREGRFDDIRLCISCNQGCVGMIHAGKPMTCLQNPAVGYEKEWGVDTLAPAAIAKKVVVVGGGPAGMEAALVAARRRHQVVILERAGRLGGQINLVQQMPKRSDFVEVIRWRESQLRKLGVTVRLHTEATPEIVRAEHPDAVIVTTGSMPDLPAVPGADGRLVSAAGVIAGTATVGERVLLVDEDNHWKGAGTADYLLDRGHQVEIITGYGDIGGGIPAVSLIPLKQRIYGKGATVTTHTRLKAVEGRDVVVCHTYGMHEHRIEDIDTIVYAGPDRADNALYRTLQQEFEAVYAAGDCYAPRRALDAIRDGHRIGRLV
jgi:mycofactocin system FadH/OYE family oxidoreductase 2